MSFFDQVYQKLFTRKNQHSSLVHELIDRKDDYLDDYRSWKLSYRLPDMIQEVATSYSLKNQGMIGDPDVHLLNTNYSNGFAISFNDRLNPVEFQYFFDWLAEKVEDLGYKRSNSDVLVTDKGSFVETKEKHYLKPQPVVAEEGAPIEQYYGNILIEHILVDERPSYIRLVANIYSDRLYKKPESFDKLAKYLLGEV